MANGVAILEGSNERKDATQLITGSPRSDHESANSIRVLEAEIRRRGLQLHGESLPRLSELRLDYREAWRIGKQGCLGVKRNLWDPPIFSGTWYFVCDGTDPTHFLVIHSHKESVQPERLVISMWDLLNGYWVGHKCRVLFQPMQKGGETLSSNRTIIIEGVTKEFYEAMIVCIHESQVRLTMMHKELKLLREGFAKVGAAPCKMSAAPRAPRSLRGYSESHVTSMARSIHSAESSTEQLPSNQDDNKDLKC